jgi:hypothetical protein
MSQVKLLIEQNFHLHVVEWTTQIVGGQAVNWYYVHRGSDNPDPNKYFVFNDNSHRVKVGEYFYAPSIEHTVAGTVMQKLGDFELGTNAVDVLRQYIPYAATRNEAHLWQAIGKLADLVHKLT